MRCLGQHFKPQVLITESYKNILHKDLINCILLSKYGVKQLRDSLTKKKIDLAKQAYDLYYKVEIKNLCYLTYFYLSLYKKRNKTK